MSQSKIIEKPEMLLAGLQVRTSLKKESDPSTAVIYEVIQDYYNQFINEKTPHRKNPKTLICAYTNYESDYKGEFDYFVGEEVTSFDELPENICQLTVPNQKYLKFDTEVGALEKVLPEKWREIWDKEGVEDVAYIRSYGVDLEVYDRRALNPAEAQVDIFVSVK